MSRSCSILQSVCIAADRIFWCTAVASCWIGVMMFLPAYLLPKTMFVEQHTLCCQTSVPFLQRFSNCTCSDIPLK
jgi:hypothetical protein